jgi:uncharacterized protein
MAGSFPRDHLELVVKISKYCNLRCSYCYEYAELGHRAVMSLENIARLFDNLSSFAPAKRPEVPDPEVHDLDAALQFVWHGGEPLLVKLSYYEAIGALQKARLRGRFSYANVVQSNLTVLTDEHIKHLKDRLFFDHLGISFDVYGRHRIDSRGRTSAGRVLANLQRLQDNGVDAGGIAVLSRDTLPHIENIYRFYEGVGMAFRILPYSLESNPEQTSVHGLRPDEIVDALCRVFDLLLQSEEPIVVRPLDVYLDYALSHIACGEDKFYDKGAEEKVFIVNIDGSTFGDDAYVDDHCYGNLFDQTFEEILASKNRQRLIVEADERVSRHCGKCPFHGACSGAPVAEANPHTQRWLESYGCVVQKTVAHIVGRLEQTGLDRKVSAIVQGRGEVSGISVAL